MVPTTRPCRFKINTRSSEQDCLAMRCRHGAYSTRSSSTRVLNGCHTPAGAASMPAHAPIHSHKRTPCGTAVACKQTPARTAAGSERPGYARTQPSVLCLGRPLVAVLPARCCSHTAALLLLLLFLSPFGTTLGTLPRAAVRAEPTPRKKGQLLLDNKVQSLIDDGSIYHNSETRV